MVEITMQELLEAGVHFGHQTRRWNPKMKPYIFGKRNGIYIIALSKTLKMFREAAEFVEQLAREGRRILFVGTKRQAQEAVAEEARRCGQYWVSHRWLGGTLTNFVTIRQSIERLLEIEARLADENGGHTKKERLRLDRERDRMSRNLEGVRDLETAALATPSSGATADSAERAAGACTTASACRSRSPPDPRSRAPARRRPRSPLRPSFATTAGGPWPPDRCGTGPCGACPRRRRRSR